MMNVMNEINKIYSDLVDIRREIHRNPEIGQNVTKTITTITSYLKENSIEYEIVDNCAVVINLGSKKNNVLLLRADIDALPIEEDTELEYKSINKGKMHACGHDIHTSIMLGVAKILKANESDLNGQVKLVFQPDEENLNGAKKLISKDILKNPKVDAAIALHVVPGQFLETGQIIMQKGPVMAGSCIFKIKVIGRGGHGANPASCIDPIYAATKIYDSLIGIKAKEIATTELLVLSIGKFSFGTLGNIIPNSGELEGTVRFFNSEIGEYTQKRINEITNNIAKAHNVKVEVDFVEKVPPVVNDEKLFDIFQSKLVKEFGSNMVKDFDYKFMSADDFAFYGEHVPIFYFNIGAGKKSNKYQYSLHNPKVIFDEKVIKFGIATYIHSIQSYFDK